MRRRVPGWCNALMYRYWILEREKDWITEEELTEEEQKRLERSKAHHPSKGPQEDPA